MSTPGIGDPYWYEWYVGLQRVIEMINPDSNISYVIFQSDFHNTIDDVVVGIGNIEEMCFQVKHEVGDAGKGNLTFSKLIERPSFKSFLIPSSVRLNALTRFCCAYSFNPDTLRSIVIALPLKL